LPLRHKNPNESRNGTGQADREERGKREGLVAVGGSDRREKGEEKK